MTSRERTNEADRLYFIFNEPNFQDTIWAWIAEDMKALVRQIAHEDDPVKGARLRGSYIALQELTDKVEMILKRRESDAKKKKEAKELLEGYK